MCIGAFLDWARLIPPFRGAFIELDTELAARNGTGYYWKQQGPASLCVPLIFRKPPLQGCVVRHVPRNQQGALESANIGLNAGMDVKLGCLIFGSAPQDRRCGPPQRQTQLCG